MMYGLFWVYEIVAVAPDFVFLKCGKTCGKHTVKPEMFASCLFCQHI